MTAIPIQVADAVAAELNQAQVDGESLLGNVTAARSYADWDLDFKGLDTMSVDVVFRTNPGNNAIGLVCAGSLRYETEIHIAIRKRFSPADRNPDTGRLLNGAVDPLVTLLQSIKEHFVKLRLDNVLPTFTAARWADTEVLSWVNQKRLRKSHFEGVVALNFVVTRPV